MKSVILLWHCDGVGGFYVRIPNLLHTCMNGSHVGTVHTYIVWDIHTYL